MAAKNSLPQSDPTVKTLAGQQLIVRKVRESLHWSTGEAMTTTEGVDPTTLERITITQFESKPGQALVTRYNGGYIRSTGWVEFGGGK